MFLDGTTHHGQSLLSGEQCLAWDFSRLKTQSISPSNCKYTTFIDFLNKQKCDMIYGICQTSFMTFVKNIHTDKLNAKQCSLLNLYLIRGKDYKIGVSPHIYVIRLLVFYRAMYARITLIVRMLHCYIRYLVTLTRPARAKVKPTDVAPSVSFCFCCRLNQTYSNVHNRWWMAKTMTRSQCNVPTFLQQWRIKCSKAMGCQIPLLNPSLFKDTSTARIMERLIPEWRVEKNMKETGPDSSYCMR